MINSVTFASKDMALIRKIIYAFDTTIHHLLTSLLDRIRKGIKKDDPVRVVASYRVTVPTDGSLEICPGNGEIYNLWLDKGVVLFRVSGKVNWRFRIGNLYWRARKPDMFVKLDDNWLMKFRVLYAISACMEAEREGIGGIFRDMVEDGTLY